MDWGHLDVAQPAGARADPTTAPGAGGSLAGHAGQRFVGARRCAQPVAYLRPCPVQPDDGLGLTEPSVRLQHCVPISAPKQ